MYLYGFAENGQAIWKLEKGVTMNCVNHPDRIATHTDSIPDATKQGYNKNESGYKIISLCDECASVHKMYIGNTSRLEIIKP
jgi:hypothetical protein